ncbi:hypothetical protein BgiMline_027194 [Biomphalaria glabrata]
MALLTIKPGMDELFSKALTQEYISNKKAPNPSDTQCLNESNHNQFIHLDQLALGGLPEKFRDKDILELIGVLSELTVHITYCFKIDENTLRYCHGSGFIQRLRKETFTLCPCRECGQKNVIQRSKEWYKLTITTASPVFKHFNPKTNTDARAELFYDNESSPVSKVDIQSLEAEDLNGDDNDWGVCFGVTHDQALATRLTDSIVSYEKLQGQVYRRYKNQECTDDKLVVVVGHPHGGPKVVTIGQRHQRIPVKSIKNGQLLCRYAYDAVTCPGSSGSPVYILGQPISGFGYWFGHPHNHVKGIVSNRSEESNESEANVSFSTTGMECVD